MIKYDKESLRRYLLMAVVLFAAMGCFYFFFRAFLPEFWTVFRYVCLLIIPFLVAWLVAIITRPLTAFLTRRLRFRPGLAALVDILLLLAVVTLVIMVAVTLIAAVISAVKPYVGNLSGYLNNWGDEVNDLFTRVDLNALGLDRYYVKIQDWLEKVSTQGAGIAFNAAKGTPEAIIAIVITLVACFYWCRDELKVRDGLSHFFPRNLRQNISNFYDNISLVLGNYIRAQAILMVIDTAICLLGFVICGISTPIAAAVFSGVLDIIPFLGPGLVIIPIAIWGFIIGDMYLGIGMSVTFLVFLVVRNVLQPKVVGDHVGLHPLLTLAAIYIGMKAFGVAGLILGPIVVALVVAVIRVRRQEKAALREETGE